MHQITTISIFSSDTRTLAGKTFPFLIIWIYRCEKREALCMKEFSPVICVMSYLCFWWHETFRFLQLENFSRSLKLFWNLSEIFNSRFTNLRIKITPKTSKQLHESWQLSYCSRLLLAAPNCLLEKYFHLQFFKIIRKINEQVFVEVCV